MNDKYGFRDETLARRLIDFEGMNYGKIRPTDLDVIYEIQNNIYILCEVKYHDWKENRGQDLCFERLCDDLTRAGKKVLGIYAVTHTDFYTTGEKIYLNECIVHKFRLGYEWHNIGPKIWTVKEAIDKYFRKHAPHLLEGPDG